MNSELEAIDRAAQFLKPRLGTPKVGIILGSGMGDVVGVGGEEISYDAVPGFPRPGVEGHRGVLSFGEIERVPVAIFRGRGHLYEGYSACDVARPVRVLARLGARFFFVTNAAGSLRRDLKPGALMLIRDHLNLSCSNPLEGVNLSEIGVRFPDLSTAYDKGLLREAARVAGGRISKGVYAFSRGPSYETPAETAMLRKLGADAAGMSTVPEVIAAAHAGLRVLGVSCITNFAAGLSPNRLDHKEVIAVTRQVKTRLDRLLRGVLERLGEIDGR